MEPERTVESSHRLPYVWDYDIDESHFRRLLDGSLQMGRLDRDWAAVRLIEYAPYHEIVRLLGFGALANGWPQWRSHVRSTSRRRGIDFLVEYLSRQHPHRL
jgi:hypothetical protein